jgi:hypothetical protein
MRDALAKSVCPTVLTKEWRTSYHSLLTCLNAKEPIKICQTSTMGNKTLDYSCIPEAKQQVNGKHFSTCIHKIPIPKTSSVNNVTCISSNNNKPDFHFHLQM